MRILILTAILALSACGKKDSSDDSGEEVEGSEELQLALQAATPSQSIDLVSKAMESLDDALEESAGALVIELTEEEEVTYGSKWCNTHGDPMSDPSDEFTSLTADEFTNSDGSINRNHPNYAARFFHCQLKINSESPDTVQGTHSLIKSILCGLEKADALDFDDPDTGNYEITIDSNCFSSKMVEENEGAKISFDITSTLVTDNENWDKKVVMENRKTNGESSDETYTFQLKNSNGEAAVKFMESTPTDDGDSVTAWTFSLKSNGELRYEAKTYGDDNEGNLQTRGIRLLIEGTMDASIKEGEVKSAFSAVDTFSGIYGGHYPHPEYEGKFAGSFATITGTSSAGFETRAYTCNSDGDQSDCEAEDLSNYIDATQVNKDAGERSCFPKSADCEGIDPILFEKGDEAFGMAVKSEKDLKMTPKEWFNGLDKPISFETLTNKVSQE